MHIIHKDLKKGILKLKIECLDDLWVLQNVIEAGDFVSGRTLRKIKATDKDGNVTRLSKEQVSLALAVEAVEFHEHTDVLRVSGVVQEGPEDVPRGSHHTFNLEPGSVITVHKREWLQYQLQRIEEAQHSARPVLVCVLDREQAFIALLERRGPRILMQLTGDVPKKAVEGKQQDTFLAEVAKNLREYLSRFPESQLVIASPSFWREELARLLPDEVQKRLTLASCTSATESALQELVRRPELAEALKQDRIYRETQLVERVLTAIATQQPVTYGASDVEQAVHAAAVSVLLVTTGYLMERRRNQAYGALEELMKQAERLKGEVHLIDSSHDAGRKLDSIGGIAALLRFRLWTG